MVDVGLVSSSIVMGIIVIFLIVIAAGMGMGGNSMAANVNLTNFVIIISFLLIVLVITIPFITISTHTTGTLDNRKSVYDAIKNTAGITSAIFIAFLIVTLVILRKYPAKISMFTNAFTGLAFFTSLLTISVYSISGIQQ